jgi:hypothetical protein
VFQPKTRQPAAVIMTIRAALFPCNDEFEYFLRDGEIFRFDDVALKKRTNFYFLCRQRKQEKF